MDDNEKAISDYVRKLDAIPTDLTTMIDVSKLLRQLEEKLKGEIRRRNSYKNG